MGEHALGAAPAWVDIFEKREVSRAIEAKADSFCGLGKDLVQLDLVMEVDVAREVAIIRNDEIDEVALVSRSAKVPRSWIPTEGIGTYPC